MSESGAYDFGLSTNLLYREQRQAVKNGASEEEANWKSQPIFDLIERMRRNNQSLVTKMNGDVIQFGTNQHFEAHRFGNYRYMAYTGGMGMMDDMMGGMGGAMMGGMGSGMMGGGMMGGARGDASRGISLSGNASFSNVSGPVSYTHLTLPTKA